MDEKQLEKLAKRMGDRAAEQIDLETTAQAVLDRLRTESAPVVWWRRPRVVRTLAAAALVVLTAGVLVTTRAVRFDVARSDVARAELFDLQSLSSAELEEVLDSLSYDGPVAELTVVGLDDLDERQLRELLTMMEG